MNEHILVVDDEIAIRDMVRMALEKEGYQVSDASNVHQAKKKLQREKIQLVLLDWMIPGVTGIDFTAQIRKQANHSHLGIIMLTAKDLESDIIRALEAGADDYMCKPFSTKEMVSRIKALTRRMTATHSEHPAPSTLQAGHISIDCSQHLINISGNDVDVSPTEFRLLHFLASNPERAFNREQLLNNVWGEQVYVDERTVDVHIRRVRKILEPFDCDHYIHTVRGVGYRFTPSKKKL